MPCTSRILAPFIAASGLVFSAGAAVGGSLLPNGNPIYTNPDTGKSRAGDASAKTMFEGKTYTVTLDPNPALFRPEGDCSWLLPALRAPAQPYNNATNTWDYKFATLQGSFTLVDYTAWAKVDPKTALGNNVRDLGRLPDGFGGAAFVINYNPMGADPKANDPSLHWIQVIDSNKPSPQGVTYGVPSPANDGTRVYMDNSASSNPPMAGIDPYYGRLGNPPFMFANGTGFLDDTLFFLPTHAGEHWQAQAFLTTEQTAQRIVDGITITDHSVTIYDGVWWGLTVSVPEPGTFILLFIGSGVAIAAGVRRRFLVSGGLVP